MNIDFKKHNNKIILFLFFFFVCFAGFISILQAQIDLEGKQILFEEKTLIKASHSRPITKIVSINDGTRIATSSKDNTIKIWDFNKEDITAELNTGEFGVFTIVAPPSIEDNTSRNQDKKIIAGGKKKITVWNIDKREIIKEWNAHNNDITSLFISKNLKYLFSASLDGFIKIWDFNTYTNIGEIKANSSVNSVVFDSETGFVYYALDDNTIRVWNITTRKEIGKLEGHTESVTCLLIYSKTPTENYLYSGSDDGTIIKWDLASFSSLKQVETEYPIIEILLDDTNNRLIMSNTVRITIYDTDLYLSSISEASSVRGLSENTDGLLTRIALDKATGKIFAGGKTDFIRIYDNTLLKEKDIIKPISIPLEAVGITIGGDKIISSGENQNLHIWSISNGRYLTEIKNSNKGTNDIKVITDKSKLITADKDNYLRIYSITDYSAMLLAEKKFNTEIYSIDYNQVLSSLAFASDNLIYIVKIPDGEISSIDDLGLLFFLEATATIKKVIFSPDGRYLLSVNWQGLVEQWDTATNEVIKSYETRKSVSEIAINTSGNLLFVGTDDGFVFEFNLNTSEKRQLNFYTAIGKIHSLFYIDEQGLLFVGGDRNEIVAYKISENKVAYTLKGNSSTIKDIVGIPNKKQIAVASADGSISLWNYDNVSLAGIFRRFSSNEWVIYTSDGYYTRSENAGKLISFYDDNGNLVGDLGYTNNKEMLLKRLQGYIEERPLEQELKEIAKVIDSAKESINNKNYEQARTSLNKAKDMIKPQHSYILPYYYQVEGDLYLANNDYQEAITSYNNALSNSEGDETFARLRGNVNKGMGDAYVGLGDLEEANKYYKQAITYKNALIEREKLDVYLTAAPISEKLGNIDDAISYYEDALNCSPLNSEIRDIHSSLGNLYGIQKNYDKAIENYNKAIEYTIDDGDKADIYGKIGDIYYEKGEYENAIKYYKSQIENTPDYRKNELNSTYDKLAKIYEKTEDPLSSYNLYIEKLKTIDPQNTEEIRKTYQKLAELSIKLGDYNAAIKNLEYARKYTRNDAINDLIENYLLVGDLYKKIGLPEKSIENYNYALKMINPTDIDKYYEVYRKIGLIYESMRKLKEALNIFLELDNAIPQIDYRKKIDNYIDIARINLRMGNDNNAFQYFDKAKSLISKIPEYNTIDFYELIAETYEQIGKLKEAIENYEIAYNLMKPSDKGRKIKNLYKTSELYEILRYIEKAIELCQKALDIPDTDDYQSLWQINNRLGDLYSKAKLFDDSLNSYNQAAKNIIQLNDYKKYAYSKFKAGEIYEKLKSNEQAIMSYKEAKSSIERAGTLTIEEGKLLGNVLYSLSNVLRKDKQFDEAMSNADKCLEVFNKIESPEKSKAIMNIGNIYFDLKQVELAEEKYYDAMIEAKKYGDRSTEAKILNNIGVLKVSQKKYNEALENYKKSVTIKNSDGDFQGVVDTYWNIAILYEKQNKFGEAIKILKEALFLIKTYNLDNASDFANYLAELENIVKNLNNAFGSNN